MKQIIYILCLLLLLCGLACTKKEMPLYEAEEYIYFSKQKTDSSSLSFYFIPGATTHQLPLEVKLIGAPASIDRTFTVVVNKSKTTAADASYSLPGQFVLHAGKALDTIYIQVNRTPDLKTSFKYIALEIQSNDVLLKGPAKHDAALISITDQATKPGWWDPNNYVETYGESNYELGRFTDKKFSLFVQVTGVAELDKLNNDEQRAAMLKFKYYLIQMKEEGKEVLEEDGTPMKVYVVG